MLSQKDYVSITSNSTVMQTDTVTGQHLKELTIKHTLMALQQELSMQQNVTSKGLYTK